MDRVLIIADALFRIPFGRYGSIEHCIHMPTAATALYEGILATVAVAGMDPTYRMPCTSW